MASREGFDLFNRRCWPSIWRRIVRRDLAWLNRYVWRDTFGRFACMAVGHRLATGRAHDSGNGYWPCFRCNKFVRSDTASTPGEERT